ncbi:CNNM domain-containing protein [Streptomyces mirabilis]|uniref:CNNM domain-containing protein n=1 Tax=Streptomyces mirabilis TaxID=68239 RepID=UPI00364AC34B
MQRAERVNDPKAVTERQRGALAGMRELSLMLAGAQLGITVCTLGLGSVSKPAISHELDPLLHDLGLPSSLSYGIAFAVAMVVVVFLHMVVGEMAPKSWAIANPERSAMLLSPPFLGLVKTVRPLLTLLNKMSNALVRLCRVTPRDELASVHNIEQRTHLVEESERLGLISKEDSELITSSLTEPQNPVGALQVPATQITSVAAGADVESILATAAQHDRNRLLVRDGTLVIGSVHARDALIARTRGRNVTARELARAVPELTEQDTISHTIEQLRQRRASLAVVRDGNGRLTGMVTLDDLLARLPAAPVRSVGTARRVRRRCPGPRALSRMPRRGSPAP